MVSSAFLKLAQGSHDNWPGKPSYSTRYWRESRGHWSMGRCFRAWILATQFSLFSGFKLRVVRMYVYLYIKEKLVGYTPRYIIKPTNLNRFYFVWVEGSNGFNRDAVIRDQPEIPFWEGNPATTVEPLNLLERAYIFKHVRVLQLVDLRDFPTLNNKSNCYLTHSKIDCSSSNTYISRAAVLFFTVMRIKWVKVVPKRNGT